MKSQTQNRKNQKGKKLFFYYPRLKTLENKGLPHNLEIQYKVIKNVFS